MSGSAGLAAAKRRRAGPSSTVTNEVPKKTPNITTNSNSQTVVQPSNNISNTHPLIILTQHEQQLTRIHGEIEDIRMTMDRKQVPQSVPQVDEQSVQFFKNKYETLSQEMDEMKKLLIKIQTFSMETNLELLKMKKLLRNDQRIKDTDEESVSNDLDKFNFNH